MSGMTTELCTCGHTRDVHGTDGCAGVQCDCTWFQSVEEL